MSDRRVIGGRLPSNPYHVAAAVMLAALIVAFVVLAS